MLNTGEVNEIIRKQIELCQRLSSEETDSKGVYLLTSAIAEMLKLIVEK